MKNRLDSYSFSLSIQGYEDEVFVSEFVVKERISSHFEISVEFITKNLENLKSRIGAGTELVLLDSEKKICRKFNGIITQLILRGKARDGYIYKGVISPQLFLLERRFSIRIFQNMTVIEILRDIVKSAGLPNDCVEYRGVEELKKREFCVQYQETDMGFVNRILQESGLYYFYEFSDAEHRLVLCDHFSCHQKLKESSRLFREQQSMQANSRSIYSLEMGQGVCEGSVAVKDYDFTRASSYVEAYACEEETGLEYYEYPGNITENSEAEGKAKLLLQEKQNANEHYTVRSNYGDLQTGYLMNICGNELLNDKVDYLITSIIHRGQQEKPLGLTKTSHSTSYSNTVSILPAELQFRSQRSYQKPRIYGAQTAIVVGPPGEEVYTDEFGRIKVQFHWDRFGKFDEKSSCWVRVGQLWAGAGWGSFTLPRIGQEVIVQFINGDPDCPLVTGSLYNSLKTPAYVLPENRFKTVIRSCSSQKEDGFNELSFEDKENEENIAIHAERNLEKRIKNDQIDWVGNDLHCVVRNDRYDLVEGDLHLTNQGNSFIQVDGEMSHKTGSHQRMFCGGDYGQEAVGEVHIKAGSKIVLEAGSEISIKVGESFIKIDSTGLTQVGGTIKLNSGGAASNGKEILLDEPQKPIGATEAESAEVDPADIEQQDYAPAAINMKIASYEGAALVEQCEGA